MGVVVVVAARLGGLNFILDPLPFVFRKCEPTKRGYFLTDAVDDAVDDVVGVVLGAELLSKDCDWDEGALNGQCDRLESISMRWPSNSMVSPTSGPSRQKRWSRTFFASVYRVTFLLLALNDANPSWYVFLFFLF